MPKPKDCDLNWGFRFSVKPTGKAFMVCADDSLMDAEHPILAYGKIFKDPRFTCVGSEKGLECTNRDGHGFFISRSRQRLF